MKNWFVNKVVTGWTAQRGELQFPEKTFNQRWKEKFGDR
jgi:L-lactate dehydrogenase complex protein LldF